MSIDEIILFFCHKMGVPPEDICRRGRNPQRWYTRYMTWLYLHHTMKIPTSVIARKFHRNRPSIFRGIRIITEHMTYHKEVREQYRAIVKELEGIAKATPSENMED